MHPMKWTLQKHVCNIGEMHILYTKLQGFVVSSDFFSLLVIFMVLIHIFSSILKHRKSNGAMDAHLPGASPPPPTHTHARWWVSAHVCTWRSCVGLCVGLALFLQTPFACSMSTMCYLLCAMCFDASVRLSSVLSLFMPP
jgi:hypothetical protein